MVLLDIRPRGHRVMLRALNRDELADRTPGGIILTQAAQDAQRHRRWEVVAVGEDVQEEALLPGARVLVQQYVGTPIELDGELYTFAFEGYISAILTEEE